MRSVKTCLRSSFLRSRALSSALKPSFQYQSRSLAPLIVLETLPTILGSEGACVRGLGGTAVSGLCDDEAAFLGLLGARARRGSIKSTMAGCYQLREKRYRITRRG